MQLNLFKYFIDKTRRQRPAEPPKRQKKARTPDQAASDLELRALWIGLRKYFFPDRPDLDSYRVYWSNRPQKRTLASCSLDRRAIRVARELNYPQHKQWLSPLLYHEMVHAYLGFSVYSEEGRSNWHGAEFKKLERRHPGIKRFDAWVKSGGWETAVRSDRAKRAYKRRKHG